MRRKAITRLLFGVLHPIDAHVFTPEEFEDTVDEELSFTWVIARQARIYYWGHGAERATPSLQARVPQWIGAVGLVHAIQPDASRADARASIDSRDARDPRKPPIRS